MNTLTKFKVAETIKDRYSTIFRDQPESACSKESIEKAADLLVNIIERYDIIQSEDGLQEATTYLMDVMGYYLALCNDILAHNKELIELLKQKGE